METETVQPVQQNTDAVNAHGEVPVPLPIPPTQDTNGNVNADSNNATDNVPHNNTPNNTNGVNTNNNNNVININPMVNVRDRLFYALFVRIALLYSRCLPLKMRRFLEYMMLLKAVAFLFVLVFVHLTFIQLPGNCLEHVKGKWPRNGILRVEIFESTDQYAESTHLMYPEPPDEIETAGTEIMGSNVVYEYNEVCLQSNVSRVEIFESTDQYAESTHLMYPEPPDEIETAGTEIMGSNVVYEYNEVCLQSNVSRVEIFESTDQYAESTHLMYPEPPDDIETAGTEIMGSNVVYE